MRTRRRLPGIQAIRRQRHIGHDQRDASQLIKGHIVKRGVEKERGQEHQRKQWAPVVDDLIEDEAGNCEADNLYEVKNADVLPEQEKRGQQRHVGREVMLQDQSLLYRGV